MNSLQKLEILADAAKYDASCASSGAARKDSTAGKGVGSTGGTGICHSYTPDGRCISLLKVLLTNVCLYDCYDCHYCINRRSSNVRRARFTPEEVVDLIHTSTDRVNAIMQQENRPLKPEPKNKYLDHLKELNENQ